MPDINVPVVLATKPVYFVYHPPIDESRTTPKNIDELLQRVENLEQKLNTLVSIITRGKTVNI
jgi:hypothetical protein